MVRLRRGLVLMGLAVAAVPVVALADQAYTDPAGDSGSAPDIVGVSVTNDVDDAVRFAIQFAGDAELPGNAALALLVDTDANGETGNDEGAEVAVGFYGDTRQYSYGRWDGKKIDDDADVNTKELAFRPGEVVIALPNVSLNSSKRFDFWVYSLGYKADAVVASDSAPDGTDVYHYSVETKPVTLKGGKPTGTPRFPVAAHRFFVSMVVTRAHDGGVVPNGVVQCVARIGKKRVPGKGTVVNGILPRCAFKIPPKTSGKVLRGTIAVSIAGGGVARSFAFKIL